MKQVLFRVPGVGIPVYGFGLLVALGFYAGLLLARRRARRQALDPDVMDGMAVGVLVGGLVGARLFYVVEYWGETVTTFAQVFHVWEDGLALYGAGLGAAAAFLLYRAFRPFPVLATLDALAPSVALGVALGRVGCFLNGCCYGAPCRVGGLAVRFPAGTPVWLAQRARRLIPPDAPATLPVHPIQLYAAAVALSLFLLLTAYFPYRRRDGEVMGLLLLTYPFTRFLTEALRDDESALWFGLTVGQASSLVLFLAGLLFWLTLPGRLRATGHAGTGAPKSNGENKVDLGTD